MLSAAKATRWMPKQSAKRCSARQCVFVPVKTVEQQSILMIHRARSLFVRQRTMVANALRAYLAEFDTGTSGPV
ncbi:hypothetical protein RGR602_PB00308 (plasmid) [Rhizobium gallicum bv. gallicum R602sp]|uniref:Transposase n=1 Tax=Rhizobium gallicum bv. gallicum R602sp TaxID=1041138 RepID=A0A0B4XBC2_9HYPH|nr:hypothetical protein RGR602_PB00308 [Rhizobium gallicum bv. gallicum R602sp]